MTAFQPSPPIPSAGVSTLRFFGCHCPPSCGFPPSTCRTAKEKGRISEAEIEVMFAGRNDARKRKDFAKSDDIRKKLSEMGVNLEDRKGGTAGWRRK